MRAESRLRCRFVRIVPDTDDRVSVQRVEQQASLPRSELFLDPTRERFGEKGFAVHYRPDFFKDSIRPTTSSSDDGSSTKSTRSTSMVITSPR